MVTRKRSRSQLQLYQRSRAWPTSPVRSSYTFKCVTSQPLGAAPQLSKNRPQTSSAPSHRTSTTPLSCSARKCSMKQRSPSPFLEKEHSNISQLFFLLAQALQTPSSRSNKRRQLSLGSWKLNASKYSEKLSRRKSTWWRVSKLKLTGKPEKLRMKFNQRNWVRSL